MCLSFSNSKSLGPSCVKTSNLCDTLSDNASCDPLEPKTNEWMQNVNLVKNWLLRTTSAPWHYSSFTRGHFDRWTAIGSNYAFYVLTNETWIGGYKHVQSLLNLCQTAMAMEVSGRKSGPEFSHTQTVHWWSTSCLVQWLRGYCELKVHLTEPPLEVVWAKSSILNF